VGRHRRFAADRRLAPGIWGREAVVIAVLCAARDVLCAGRDAHRAGRDAHRAAADAYRAAADAYRAAADAYRAATDVLCTVGLWPQTATL
jgi:hypothetical protein